ncbi:MAG: sodium:solute symporter family protein [Christensenellales bacterium]
MLVKTLIVLVFVVITIYVGLYFRKRASSVGEFVLGGRNVGAWLSAFAYGTAYFSAVIFVGYAGQFGWKYGVSATWIGVGNALIGSLLAWLLLARRTRIMSHHLSSTTMPDFFGKRYDSKKLKTAASVIVFVFLIPYTASLYNGLSRIFEMAFHIDYSICVIIMAVLTGVYVVAGGYMATAVNDFIQGIIMLGGIVAVIAAVLSGQGGFTAAIQKLTVVQDVAAGAQTGAFTSIFGPQPLNLLGVVILTSLGTWGMPQLVHKFYAIKDERAIRRGTVISTVFALIIAGGCYFLGGFGRLFSGQVDPKALDSIIPTMLQSLPDILIGIVVILVLSASMSTLSSLVLTSSSTVTLDLFKGSVVKDMDEKRKVFIMRIFIVVFIAISVAIALIQYTSKVTFIAQLMGISWGAVAGSFLAPFLYGLYWKRVTKTAVWTSFIVGVGITVSNLFLVYIDSPINAGAITMIATLILVPVVSLVTPRMKAEKVAETFACFQAKQ